MCVCVCVCVCVLNLSSATRRTTRLVVFVKTDFSLHPPPPSSHIYYFFHILLSLLHNRLVHNPNRAPPTQSACRGRGLGCDRNRDGRILECGSSTIRPLARCNQDSAAKSKACLNSLAALGPSQTLLGNTPHTGHSCHGLYWNQDQAGTVDMVSLWTRLLRFGYFCFIFNLFLSL